MKKSDNRIRRVIISGGGTGGHIFPAVAIANAIVAKYSPVHILFVGAKGRMEMEKVPEAGYKIIGLPVRGLDRKHLLKNFRVLWQFVQSLIGAREIVKRFKPDVVVGVGGYASGPLLYAAGRRIPAVIQEQNSYAGVTNRLLAKRVKRICVAYDGMERFFPREKIVFTGNPVRELLTANTAREQSARFFNFENDRPTVLVVGGSLGARTINQSVEGCLDAFPNGIHIVWQTGTAYYERACQAVNDHGLSDAVKVFRFINRMDLAYAVADLVISRAGAGTVSELCILAKPCILVPSPNVAEDHQTKNAMALVAKQAALMIGDGEAREKLMPLAFQTVNNCAALEELSRNIRSLAKFNAAENIADIVMGLINGIYPVLKDYENGINPVSTN